MRTILLTHFRRPALLSLFFLALAGTLSLSSCKKDDSGEEKRTTYTIMLYGCGGGNLDQYMMLNLEEAGIVGSTDEVSMTAQIKFSKAYQDDPDLSGTRRFVMGEEDWEKEVVMSASLPLNEPANLADFIDWSKKQRPADKYILILWNHGNGWYPSSDMPIETRGVLFDDNLNNRAMSSYELTEGLRLSNTTFEMIYFDACLMNMFENLGELLPYCKYTLAAGHITPGIGGEYSILMTLLSQEDDFVTAIRKYGRAVLNHWVGAAHMDGEDYAFDLTLTEMSKLPAVFDIMKELADELVDTYEEFQEIYDAIDQDDCYFYDNDYPYVDIDSYIETLALNSGNPMLYNIGSRFTLATDEAIVCQFKNRFAPDELTWSVTLVNKTQWNKDYEPKSTSYSGLEFEKRTGWSRWLKLHNMEILPRTSGTGHDH